MGTEAAQLAARPLRRAGHANAFGLATIEARGSVRSTAFRLVALVGFVMGWAAGSVPGHGAGPSAWAAGDAAWRYFGFLVIVWMSLAAVRDTALRTDALVFSKPQPTERLVLAKFLSILAQLLLANAAVFAGALVGHIVVGGGLGGLSAYLLRYSVSAGVLFFFGASSFVLAVLTGTPLAGAVVGLALVMALAGRGFLAKALIPAYTQNVPSYVFFGIAMVAIACWAYRRQRRGGRPASATARIAAPVALALGAWSLYSNLANGHDPIVALQPALMLMESQNATLGGIAPGFRLPDQRGRLVSPADYPGRILIIALWSPADSESVAALERLQRIHGRYSGRGVQPIAICLSEDVGAAAAFAIGDVVSYPVLSDWGAHHAPIISDSSPLANAYQIHVLPHLVITDRRRRIRTVLSGLDAGNEAAIRRAIDDRLAEEPE